MRLDEHSSTSIIEARLELLRTQETEASGQEPIDEELLASIRAEMEKWQTVLSKES